MRARRVVTASPILRRAVAVSKSEKHVDCLSDGVGGLDSFLLCEAAVCVGRHRRGHHYSAAPQLRRRGHITPPIADVGDIVRVEQKIAHPVCEHLETWFAAGAWTGNAPA